MLIELLEKRSGHGSYDPAFLMICIAPCIKSQNCSYLIAFEILYNSIKVEGLWPPYCYAYERTNRLHVYRCLLTNRLHGKAAELCLANSRNNSVTTTKYMCTLIASQHITLFYQVVLVKFYCDIITEAIYCLPTLQSTTSLVNFVLF